MDELTRSGIDRAGRRIRHSEREEGESLPGDLAVVDAFRGEHIDTLEEVQGRLTGFFHERVELPPERYPITSRLKTPKAIRAKLCRSTTALSRMQDIAGARIVVPSLQLQDVMLPVLIEEVFGAHGPSIKDQRIEPDQWGYRAIHIVITAKGHLAEVQLRTLYQDRWAQVVEGLDAGQGWDLKHGRGPAEWLEWLHDLGDEFRKADLGEPWDIPPTPFDKEAGE